MAVLGQAVLAEVFPIADASGDGLEAAVRAHARLVYRVAYSVLRNHHDAEDAVQETFLRVLRRWRNLSHVRDQRAWLARIAWRVALDRKKVVAGISLDQAAEAVFQLRAAGAGAEEIAAGNEMAALLNQMIASLPRGLREAVTLSTAEEMTSAEVAAVLGIPAASARTRLFRARQLLREKLSSVLEGRHAREG
jgi:RNA polymerase sigma-70 factor (ECF subfamily)